MENKPYAKTLQDELDWKLLDQLYGVVAQISSFCFETKKFCVTTEFVVLTLMVKFTNDTLDHSIFVAALVIPLCFWFLDATGYFYQVKLRGTMESIRQRLAAREGSTLVTAQGEKVISPERISHSALQRVLEAAFNHSMWLYAVLVGAAVIVWALFIWKLIK
jgi:hypothetical protein